VTPDPSLLDICADVVARALAAGADEAEAYLESSTSRTVDARGGEIESITNASARGVGVRVLIGGALGFASGTDLDAAGRADLAEQAVWLARASAPDAARILPDSAPLPAADLAIYDPAVAELSIAAVLDILTRTERAALADDPRIDAAHIERFGQTVGQVAIANSRGVAASAMSTSCYISLSVIAREGDVAERGHANMVTHGPGPLDPERVGIRAAQRAVTAIGGKPLATQRGTVVFEPETIAEFLRGLAQALAGDAVGRGRSLFTGGTDRFGSRVGSSVVNLMDDGALPGGPASFPFDGEGSPSGRTSLIEGGILRGFLHNAESGRRMGTVSTGNGVRPSYRSLPEVGPTNLVLRPGECAPAALVASVDDGLYVVSTRNVGGINAVSGDYSVGASGRRIVRGELAEPVSGVTLAASMLDLLGNIREVGSDFRWCSGQGGYVGAPSVVVDDMSIGGS